MYHSSWIAFIDYVVILRVEGLQFGEQRVESFRGEAVFVELPYVVADGGYVVDAVAHGVDNAIFHQEGVDYAEDFSVVPQVLYLAKRAAVDAYVYYYRVDNANSYTHSISDKNLVSLMKAHTMVYDFFRSTADFNSYKTDLAFGIENVFKTAVLNKREPSSLIDYLPADYDCGPFSIYHKLIF